MPRRSSSPRMPWLRAMFTRRIAVADSTGPDDPVARESVRARYNAALDALPAETRAIFLLHRAEGLAIDAIAIRTGRASAQVEEHLAQAMLAILCAFEDGAP